MGDGLSKGRIRFGVLAAFCAGLLAIGLARFAYTPLLPALIGAHWFTAGAAAYLGAANLIGYLAGAMLARGLAMRASSAVLLRLMMVLATLSFFACAAPVSFIWFFFWRFVSGLTGGVLMVLAAPSVLAHVPHTQRGRAGGFIFAGIGIGIIAAGTLVPALIRHGLGIAWLGLGGLALLLTVIAWFGWLPDHQARLAGLSLPEPPSATAGFWPLYLCYGLVAVGLVPHMLFLVNFIARGLHEGIETGAHYWVLFGVGAVFGPMVNGRLADRIGFQRGLMLAFIIIGLAVLLPVLSDTTLALGLSSLIVGGYTPGIALLLLGRFHELRPGDIAGQKTAWGMATIAFALFQAGAAYMFSFLFAHHSGYDALFGLGAGALALALLIDRATVRRFR